MTHRIRAWMFSLVLAAGLSVPTLRAQAAGQTFPSAEAAVSALIGALQQNDEEKLLAILGPGSQGLVASGDHVADIEARKKFVAAYQAKHQLAADGPDRMSLIVGPNDFPVPLPIVQLGGEWHFDSQLGAQELIDRRIGKNEIAAIGVALAYCDAQKLYFDMATEQNGKGEYAQHLVSTPGTHDGLYWPAEDGDLESPLAPLVKQAEDEGYPGEIVSGKPAPYQGYNFRILKAQGWDAPGGKKEYVANGRMTKGFGLVAWPARYGVSGVMTFVVDADCVVFQKNLGPKTEAIAAAMRLYDPDLSWARIDVVQ